MSGCAGALHPAVMLVMAKRNKEYKSAVIPYSKAWYFDFAAKMYARLPRELRDMIYHYLLDDENFERPALKV